MISVTVVLDYRTTNKNGSHPLKLSANFVPHVREGIKSPDNKKYISLTDEEFSKLYSPKLKDPSLLEIRDLIDKRRKQLDTIIKRLDKNKILTRENYIKYCDKKKKTSELTQDLADGNTPKRNNKKPNIYNLFQSMIDKMPDDTGTKDLYQSGLYSFMKYKPKVSYSELTPEFFKGYENFMLAEGNELTTVGINCRSFRTAVCEARRRHYISNKQYPFGTKKDGKYPIPEGNDKKAFLDDDGIKALFNYQPADIMEDYAKSMWLFCFLANGMNPCDMFRLQPKKYMNSCIMFKRTKTRKTAQKIKIITVPFNEYLLDIIKRWGIPNPQKNDYVFPLLNGFNYIKSYNSWEKEARRQISNELRKINKILLKIEKKLKLEVHLNMALARHSWSSFHERKNTPVTYISNGLGHTSLDTTMRYLGGFTLEEQKEFANQITNLITAI